ncbi:MAG TPA: hypothetical protein PLK67_14480, partial [Bryobacteraceae bacterium]|nr:hypothetical protein [Bryobacteraceae bacterium]
QFSVAALPRSIVLGSAENWMLGLAGGGAGVSAGGGGGGGGGGTFFLQPAAIKNRDKVNSTTPIFRLVIYGLCLLVFPIKSFYHLLAHTGISF